MAVITRCPTPRYYRGRRKAGLHGIPSCQEPITCLFLRATLQGFCGFFHAFLREEEQYDTRVFFSSHASNSEAHASHITEKEIFNFSVREKTVMPSTCVKNEKPGDQFAYIR